MNNIDKRYQELLQDILDNGVNKGDRTGTGTLSVFGRMIRHNMKEGFPLLTTKKMAIKSIITELRWFLKGDTNIQYLVQNGCNIWNGDAYKHYKKEVVSLIETKGGHFVVSKGWANETREDSKIQINTLTQKEFVEKIKTDDEFAKKWGELGPIYGGQWKFWRAGTDVNKGVHTYYHYDQIEQAKTQLLMNPDSRRIMVNAWNVGELDKMVLPPCHYGFQLYTRELSMEERWKIADLSPNMSEIDYCNKLCDEHNVPTRAISLLWNQRSVDTFLGLPFNIASYALLLMLFAEEVNMIPEELIGSLGDTHLYLNHIEQAKEQIGRELTFDERCDIAIEQGWFTEMGRFDVPETHWMLDHNNIPKRTREPKKLPTVKILDHDDSKLWGDFDLEINDYNPHPKIKAPLSN